MTRFAVIIPTYNRPDLLTEALRSVQAQSYPHWMAIVINDASTADYSAVEQEFVNDRRIQFVNRKINGGVNHACNTGLEMISKREDIDFVSITDDDDRWEPDYLEHAAEVIADHPQYGWFMSNNVGESKSSSKYITREQELDYIDDYIYRKFRGDKGRLIAAPLLKDLRFDERFRSSHRWPFFIDIAERTKIWAFPHDSIRKRYLEDGITHDRRSKVPRNRDELFYPAYKHRYMIRKRPRKWRAYRYLFLELAKIPRRAVRMLVSRVRHDRVKLHHPANGTLKG